MTYSNVYTWKDSEGWKCKEFTNFHQLYALSKANPDINFIYVGKIQTNNEAFLIELLGRKPLLHEKMWLEIVNEHINNKEESFVMFPRGFNSVYGSYLKTILNTFRGIQNDRRKY